MLKVMYTGQWRHNGRDGVSNYQPRGCLLSRLFGRKSKKTSKLRVTGLCVGNSPVTGEFPAQTASNAEFFSIWWRHYVYITFNKYGYAASTSFCLLCIDSLFCFVFVVRYQLSLSPELTLLTLVWYACHCIFIHVYLWMFPTPYMCDYNVDMRFIFFFNKNIMISNTGRNKWYTIYLKQRLQTHKYDGSYIDGLIQERRNSIANALELRLFPLTQRCVHLSMSICPDYV